MQIAQPVSSVFLIMYSTFKKYKAQIVVFTSGFILIVDWIYKTIMGISSNNREECILYNIAPRIVFLFYEYFVELILLLVVSIFIGNIILKYFSNRRNFVPKTQFTAFLYASVLPVCSCSVVPFLEMFKDKIKPRVLFTFVIAAPLLNPYIIAISYGILGVAYGTLRVLGSFILSVTTGWFLEKMMLKTNLFKNAKTLPCQQNDKKCIRQANTYQKTLSMVQLLFPYILVAGIMGVGLEFFNPVKILQHHYYQNSFISVLVAVIVGIPVYMCNGADILFLFPLVRFAKFSLGPAVGFSLASTAICISSVIMLSPYLGKKGTLILLILITLLIIFISMGIEIGLNFIKA